MTPRRSAHRNVWVQLLVTFGLLVTTLLVSTHPAAAAPPANGEPPTLTGAEANGDVYVGSTLYADAGRWSGVPAPTFSYRWQYATSDGGWADIAGATGPTYTVQPSDLGFSLRVNVTAANGDPPNPELGSAGTNKVTNSPFTPPTPPAPPPDVLGSPLNSRVVSSDGLLVTVDATAGGVSNQDNVVGTTNSAGDLAGSLEFFEPEPIGAPNVLPHSLPRVTTTGRFLSQNYDDVLMLTNRLDKTEQETGPSQLVLRSASRDPLVNGNTPAPSIQGGKSYGLQGFEGALAEIAGAAVVATDESSASATGAREGTWAAIALPAVGPDVFAFVNQDSGRCLGNAEGAPGTVLVVVSECAWGDLPPEQQWTVAVVDPSRAMSSFVNRASGWAMAQTQQGVLEMVPADPANIFQHWNLWLNSVQFGGQSGDEVPSYSFSADPLTYTMAAGDLDRVSEFGDIYQYHDEAVIAWVPKSATPIAPQLRVVDYVATGAVRPVPLDITTALPASGAVQNQGGSNFYLPGSIGLAVGDYDGDSFNELAYTWQDSSGTFRVTMLEYRATTTGGRTLAVVGPVDGTPLFTGTGAPTPLLAAGLAETKAGDFDGDGRDDVAIAYAGVGSATPNQLNAYLGMVSFTQDLGVRGQQFAQVGSGPLFTGAPAFGVPETRGLRLAPGLFRMDPDVGYTMERRQLAVAWTEYTTSTHDTYVAVYSFDPDPTCSQAICTLTANPLAAPKIARSSPRPADTSEYPLPLSFTAGGLRGRGADENPPVWGMALAVNDVGEDTALAPDSRLVTLALNADTSAATGYSVAVLSDISVNSASAAAGAPELPAVTAFDPAGASLVLGAPAIVEVQGLRRATLVAAQPPVHADWDWDLTNSSNGEKGAFANVSRYSNFTVTLGNSTTKTYQHTHTHDTTWNAGVTESTDVKGSFNNDLGVEATTASVEAKQKFQKKWEGSGSDFNNSESTTSISLTQVSNDDDLFQGSIENSTLYRYPILGGPLRNADGTPVTTPGSTCGQTCYGVYEVVIPGDVTPLATSGRLVDFFDPTWENGNALSYPVIREHVVPTPDLGAYTYTDTNGNTQSVTATLLSQEYGVGGAASQAQLNITGTTGSGNSSGSGNSWDLSGDVTATASYRAGPKLINYAGSVQASIGGFGGQSTSTNDIGQTIDTSASSFTLNVPEISSPYGYNIGTAYYYDTGGAARVTMSADLTAEDWWNDNYGEQPDPALNLPNRMFVDNNQYQPNVDFIPYFATTASHQAIRGFKALHTDVVDSPSYANKEYTTNPAAGDQVRFEVPVRNYSFVAATNVAVSFYAVPMKYNGTVPVPDGPPVSLGEPQIVPSIDPLGSANVSSPVWTATTGGLAAGIRPWRIFVVVDEANTIAEIHEWKDANGACPTDALDPQPAKGTVVNGVMVDPMTGLPSALACGQNNQGYGDISVSTAAAGGAAPAVETMTVLDMANRVEEGAPGVQLTAGGVRTDDPATDVIDPGEIARVRNNEDVQAVAYVSSGGESSFHQPVLVYDGPPDSGELVAVTTLRGATAAGGDRVEFNWRPDEVGLHTLHVRLLGHVAAGEDDLLTIPVLVEEPSETAKFVPVAPTRILDTRTGIGVSGSPVAGGTAITLPVAGEGIVPTGATAVALNVTGDNPADAGFVTVWPSGAPRPNASTLNFSQPGEVAANGAVVPLGADGDISLYTQQSADLVADITGYWVPADASTDGRFTAVDPARILDTRTGNGAPAGKVGAGGQVDVQVTGRGGVPASGVAAVALTATFDQPDEAGFVTVWPSGSPKPWASTLNPTEPGDIRANLAIVPVGPDGKVSLSTYAPAHLVLDVAGWFSDGSAPSSGSGLLRTITPTRLLDTRTPALAPFGRLAAGTEGSTLVSSLVPGDAQAVFSNITMTNTVGPGFVSARPGGTPLPLASNVNATGPDQHRAALALTRVGDDGTITYHAGVNDTDLVVDVSGWIT